MIPENRYVLDNSYIPVLSGRSHLLFALSLCQLYPQTDPLANRLLQECPNDADCHRQWATSSVVNATQLTVDGCQPRSPRTATSYRGSQLPPSAPIPAFVVAVPQDSGLRPQDSAFGFHHSSPITHHLLPPPTRRYLAFLLRTWHYHLINPDILSVELTTPRLAARGRAADHCAKARRRLPLDHVRWLRPGRADHARAGGRHGKRLQ